MTNSQDTVTESRQEGSISGPHRIVEVGTTRYTLLGTAHVSAESAEDVRHLIRSGEFDAVAIELCDARHRHLTACRQKSRRAGNSTNTTATNC